MSSSFITKDDEHGFWINDGLMEVVCWGLVCVIDRDRSSNPSWLVELRDHLYKNSQGFFVSYMHLSLDDFLINNEREIVFLEVIAKTKLFFWEWGSRISAVELNAFQASKGARRTWNSSLETERVVKILTYLEDVVNDKIKIKASDEINYAF